MIVDKVPDVFGPFRLSCRVTIKFVMCKLICSIKANTTNVYHWFDGKALETLYSLLGN